MKGWDIVVGKDEFSAGDQVVYFEIDSALPLSDKRFAHLGQRGSRMIDGAPYHVLKTIRLRGQYSQGLVMKTDKFKNEISQNEVPLEDAIGVFKYEKPVPQNVGGTITGGFLPGIPKTDALRVQNISERNYATMIEEGNWVATEKIDGTSGTFYNDPDDGIRVASRNWELARSEDQVHWNMVDKYDLGHYIPKGWTVQGEVAGPGIQSNRLGLPEVSLFVFRVLDDAGRDVPRILWPDHFKSWAAPIYEDMAFPQSVEEAVEQVDGLKSLVSPGRLTEGVVWWDRDGREFNFLGRPGFKAISNKYLAKEKD